MVKVELKGPTSRFLRLSPFYWEKVGGMDLAERAEKGLVSFLLINQPPLCNFKCRKCFMEEEERAKGMKGALTVKECSRLLKEMKDRGVLSLEISGEGEPLVSPHLMELVKEAWKVDIPVTVITNGSLLTRDKVKFFKDHDVTLIVSLSTLDPRKYALECGVDEELFWRVLGNVLMAREIYGNAMETEEGLVYRFGIHAVAQADTLGDMKDLRKFCDQNDIFLSIAPLAHVGEAEKHPEIHLLPRDVGGVQRALELSDTTIILSHASAKHFGRPVCGTCAYGLNIGFDGALLFDAHAGYELGDKLGNVRTTPMEEILRRRDVIVKVLFRHLEGFCPVRDEGRWKKVLKSALEARSFQEFEEKHREILEGGLDAGPKGEEGNEKASDEKGRMVSCVGPGVCTGCL